MDDREEPLPLDKLDARLRAARAESAGPRRARPSMASAGAAFRVAVDLVAGVAVGVGLGLVFDRWLGTQPWFLLGFFVLGAAAGIRNVVRTAERLERERKASKAAPPET